MWKKVLKVIFILIGIFTFSFLGYYLATQGLGPTHLSIYLVIIFVAFYAIIGLCAGEIVARGLIIVTENTIQGIRRASGADIFVIALGTIFGIIIAFFISYALRLLPSPFHYLTATLSFIFLGYLGFKIAVTKRAELAKMVIPIARMQLKEKTSAIVNKSYKILDTSAIVDGRLLDLCKTGFIEGLIVIPHFVMDELQSIADSSDDLKHSRGRRGIEILNTLKEQFKEKIEISEKDFPDSFEVDDKLIRLAKSLNASIITTDYNLNRIARIEDIKVLNVNELANALKPVVLPGEELKVKVIKEGKESGQGVAFLDDGTMVVVEHGKNYIGRELTVTVSSVLQSPAGRMIFTKPQDVK